MIKPIISADIKINLGPDWHDQLVGLVKCKIFTDNGGSTDYCLCGYIFMEISHLR